MQKRIGLFFLNIFFILICLLCLIPVLYALGISLNGHNDLLSSNFSLIPQNALRLIITGACCLKNHFSCGSKTA
jgi:ABC-type glycerol-3-phosphate transport system permease component